ncbi:hypothetical protein DLM45_13895 [Hyphomicrobium methylovorum]|uniref:hypothetical protein n=1 Tax=Hyphomicrobium methylovorum TaxID=84 RepID=UPI0015E6CF65|nr:hypothetical protein [Hyphomicrobium methylovorum]MBA2127308.1 hypothetical protein [Hyphomicrobium methylovorum]
MPSQFNLDDVPSVNAADFKVPMDLLIQRGHGLALITGLTESEIRALESEIWNAFADQPEVRLPIALRFRALLHVFAARRLRNLLLERGFKVLTAALIAASEQRLNTRFGFSAHRLFLAIDAATAPSQRTHLPQTSFQAAA